MSIIKQISVYDGSSWGINDIGANAGNIDLIASDSSTATNLAGSSNLFTALNNILPTNQLTASRALVTNSSKKLDVSTTTATQLSYVHGVTSNIQTQIDTLNTKLTTYGVTDLLGTIRQSYTGITSDSRIVLVNYGYLCLILFHFKSTAISSGTVSLPSTVPSSKTETYCALSSLGSNGGFAQYTDRALIIRCAADTTQYINGCLVFVP